MRNLDDTTITQAVLATHRSAANARLGEVMTSLVQHLHAFARDIRLSEQEWHYGVEFLEQAGQASGFEHSELALLSHVLGLSALVLAQNKTRPGGCTEAAVLDTKPAPLGHVYALDADIGGGNGPKGWVQGTVRDTQGQAVPYATVQVTLSGSPPATPALLQTNADGSFRFTSSLPQSQRIPAKGPVSTLLAALDRPTWRPAHMAFVINAEGYRPLTTLVFQEDDPYLASDALFGVRTSLIAEWKRQPPGTTPNGRVSKEPFYTLVFDFVLAPA